MEEKGESQNNKLEEIKKEQVKTKKAINKLKEEQKKTNNMLNELKVEQAKTTNKINETNKLLTELINLAKDQRKNQNQNEITMPQNNSEQIKNIIEINEIPRYINISKKPSKKRDEMPIISLINNLEISDENAKKKSIEEKGHKLQKNNLFNFNKITTININLKDN